MLQLKKKVFSVLHTFVPIPIAFQSMPRNANVTIAGWGLARETSDMFTKMAKKAEVNWIDQSECIPYHYVVPNNTFCLYSPNNSTGPCWGDYGGPVIHNGTLVGIVLMPRNRESEICNLLSNPTICSDVLMYRNWIMRYNVTSFASMLIVSWDIFISSLAIALYVENLIYNNNDVDLLGNL